MRIALHWLPKWPFGISTTECLQKVGPYTTERGSSSYHIIWYISIIKKKKKKPTRMRYTYRIQTRWRRYYRTLKARSWVIPPLQGLTYTISNKQKTKTKQKQDMQNNQTNKQINKQNKTKQKQTNKTKALVE